jgi:hypothetical protein
MIQHFSKWVKLVALLDKSSHNTSHVFLQQVLNRFGACVECLYDQGSEFRGEFQDLLDMLSLTITKLQGIIPKLMALQKGWFRHAKRDFERFASLRTKRIGTWPYLTLPWVIECPNTSLCLISPYFLFFGRHPIPPFSIPTQMDQVVDLDSPTTWARVIVERVVLFRRVMPMAMENLSIAQHRDTLQYAHTRGGSYKPKVRQFDVGDFVYLQRQPNDILNTSFSHIILRIKAIRPSGVLEL